MPSGGSVPAEGTNAKPWSTFVPPARGRMKFSVPPKTFGYRPTCLASPLTHLGSNSIAFASRPRDAWRV